MQTHTAPGGALTPQEAAGYLADLGFTLLNSAHPQSPQGMYLLVALRDPPTLRHFDPEWIMTWVTDGGRGRQERLDRSTPLPHEARFAWGTIRLFDRLNVFNTFVTFGGEVRMEVLDPGSTVVRFHSAAPILRWTGHSQPTDARAADVESFFARLMLPIDFQPGAEALVGHAEPLALYAAMIEDLAARLAGSPGLREARPGLETWVRGETARLRAQRPDALEAGRGLLVELEMSHAATPTGARS